MTESGLHQLTQDVLQLRNDFDNHLVIERIRQESADAWRASTTVQLTELTKDIGEVCSIIKDGKQSWRTLLFAGGVVLSMFTFLVWAIKTVAELKGIFK